MLRMRYVVRRDTGVTEVVEGTQWTGHRDRGGSERPLAMVIKRSKEENDCKLHHLR